MTALDDAWQAALAAEQQAAFGYGVLGPHLEGAERTLAYSFALAHETLRDNTASALASSGTTPVAPKADYPALYPVADRVQARRLALRLEDGCAQAWRFLYLQAAKQHSDRARSLRGTAQQNLTDSAVRSVRWRRLVTPAHPTTPFPGL
jgi:Domain of unknown function (DUF4439)